MMAMLLSVTACQAQKKAVNAAKNKAMNTESPDFAGAREAIKSALVDETTKDLADTWYVAGLIGYKENEWLMVQTQLGKNVDQAQKGNALKESYDYWMKAIELTYVPTYDKKGNPKYDTKTRKAVTDKLLEYPKSERTSIVFRPSTLSALRAAAEEKGTSFNELCNEILENYLKGAKAK